MMRAKNKIYVYFVVIILILVSWWFWGHNEKVENVAVKNIKTPMLNEKKTEVPKNYSRITFFNSTDHRASLAIPEDWEGEYRIKELGDRVDFINISDPEEEKIMFYIKYYPSRVWEKIENKENQTEITSNENGVYVYVLSTVQDYNNNTNDNYTKMLNESKDIAKNIRIY